MHQRPGELFGQTAEGLFLHQRLTEAHVHAADHLPARDKLVLSLSYVEALNLRELGEVLGVSESRVSQILSANVKKLRTQIGTASRPR